jgi:hypothetical protein
MTLTLYNVKEVGNDYVVLADNNPPVKITFAGGIPGTSDLDPPTTKEENARFFARSTPLAVGLETPITPTNKPGTLTIYMDHYVDLFGLLRAVPFPFHVSRVEFVTD